MANMSYCQFENTLRDLYDCHSAMREPTTSMSEYERAARVEMFGLIRQMAREIEEMGF